MSPAVFGVLGLAGLALGLFALWRRTAFFTYHGLADKSDRQVDLAYGSARRQRLDLYRPRRLNGHPAVLFVHGGYWISGNKNYRQWLSGLYGNIGRVLAARGWPTAIMNYRLSGPGVSVSHQLDDVAVAAAWLKRRSQAPIWLMGHSAGGHLVCQLAAMPDRLREHGLAASDIAGLVALSPVLDIPAMAASHSPAYNSRVTRPVFGDTADQWQRWSPTAALRQHSPPFPLLVAWGSHDFTFIKDHLASTTERLKSHLNIRTAIIIGYSHTGMVINFGRRGDRLVAIVSRFMSRQKPQTNAKKTGARR